MKNLKVIILSTILLGAMTAMPGCYVFGNHAREKATLPAVVIATEGIEQDANAGVSSFGEDAQLVVQSSITDFFNAVRSKERAEIRSAWVTKWPTVKASVSAGIDAMLAGEIIGPMGAKSLRERLIRYEAGLLDYLD